ncbi:hypothetical protein [Halorubellus salinus]|uniref:hypothetical protein n=1 Tax=Halorubellus salinus TaxID=755309 RepID=UPI001D0979C4|nr:hypothetical protein [Halorubellus salinus]
MQSILLQLPVIDATVTELVVLVIAALAGGAFGAAIGALPAFIFTGFVVFLGEGLAILRNNVGGAVGDVGAGELATGITGVIGFGMVTGPHVAFAGGVAASAYAGKKYPEMEPDDWDYHFGKNILYAFGTKPDILAVGAIFGVFGMLFNRIFAGIFAFGGFGLTDSIAVTVVASAFLARVVFGYPIVGKAQGKGFFDMTPFEREEPHMAADGGTQEHAGRLATEPWLPHQYKWSGVAAIGLVGGVLGGYLWLRTGSIFLGYAISAISLLFLQLGVEKIPVTHHITLLGSVGAVVAAETVGSDPVVLIAAGVLGMVSGLAGEATQRVFYSHSGTHVDPPAMAIALVMLIVGVLAIAGVIPTAGYL